MSAYYHMCPHTVPCKKKLLLALNIFVFHTHTPYIARLVCWQQEAAADAENAAREMIDSPSGGKAPAC